VLVVVLVGVPLIAYFAIGALGGDDDGGADSPEAAVQDLAAAVGEEDAIGVVNSLNPEEVGPLVDLYEAAAARSEELGLLELDDAGAPPDLEIEVEGLELQTEQLADGVARVTIEGGQASALLDAADEQVAGVMDGADVPILDFGEGGDGQVEDLEGEVDADELGEDLFDGESQPFLIVVDDGDGWYVSPSYTIAEGLAVANGWDEPDYDAGDEPPEGADSPEAAVQGMAEAIAGFDVASGAALLPPGEARWAQDYLDTIVEAIGPDEIDDALDDTEPELEDLQLRVEEEGDGEAFVVIESVTFSYEDEDDGHTTVELDGDCLTVQDEYSDGEEDCIEDALEEEAADPALADLVPDEQGVVVVERDGGWFVSPVRTVAHYVQHVVDNLGDRQIEALGLLPPTPIEVGETVQAEASTGYTLDSYTFDAEEDGLYVITGLPDDEDDEIFISRTLVSPEEDGPVTFQVAQRYEGDPRELTEDPFSYEVTVTEADAPDEVLEVGDEVDGSFDGEPFVLFELDPGTAGEVELSVDGDVREAGLYDDLSFEEGYGPVTTFTPGEPSSWYAGGDELLYLLVEADDPDGDFTLGAEEVADEPDDPSDPTDPTDPPVPGAPDSESFDGPYDVSFSGTITDAAPTQAFELDGDGSCYDVTVVDSDGAFDPYLTVLDPSGAEELTDDDGAESVLDSFGTFCTTTGEVGWQLEVRGFGESTGTFVVFVDEF
jgi:hypothetical protein